MGLSDECVHRHQHACEWSCLLTISRTETVWLKIRKFYTQHGSLFYQCTPCLAVHSKHTHNQMLPSCDEFSKIHTIGEQKRLRLRVCASNAMANTIVPMGLSACICLASFCFIFLVRILIESERKWKLERIRWKQCEENGNVGESCEREGNIGNKWETNTIAIRRRNANQHVNNWLECVAAYEQKCVSAQCFVWCFRGIHRICPHTHCAYSSWMSCVRSPLNGDAAAAASHFCYFALSMLISRERFHIHIL